MNSLKIYSKKILQEIQLNQRAAKSELNLSIRKYTFFKDINFLDLKSLRIGLANGKHNIVWSEKILRFLEINYKSMNDKLRKNPIQYSEYQKFIIILVYYLLEYSFFTKDLRYLNVSLKLINKYLKSGNDLNYYAVKLSEYLLQKLNA